MGLPGQGDEQAVGRPATAIFTHIDDQAFPIVARFVELHCKAVEAGLVHASNVKVSESSGGLPVDLLTTFLEPMIVEPAAQNVVGDGTKNHFEGFSVAFQFECHPLADFAVERDGGVAAGSQRRSVDGKDEITGLDVDRFVRSRGSRNDLSDLISP